MEQGASGIYLKELFVRIGIADEIKSKIKPAPTAAAEFVANGEAEIGMTQISEILPYTGAELVGPLPKEIQNYTVYAAGIGATTKHPDAAKALIAVLSGPLAQALFKSKGMDAAGE